MKSPETLSAEVKQAFQKINEESMAGLPIVNPMLDVETIGFMEVEGRTVGIIVTPWLMTLAVFPGDADDWSAVQVGEKRKFAFPSRDYKFTANEIDGIGTYFGFPLHSPMHEFEHQEHAIANAEAFMEVLLVENENAEDTLDEDRLAMFLQGEDMETIKQKECAAAKPATDGIVTLTDKGGKPLGRREFLSGGVGRSGATV